MTIQISGFIISGEIKHVVKYFILFRSQINNEGICTHEIKNKNSQWADQQSRSGKTEIHQFLQQLE